MIDSTHITGLVLAGGRGSRMGGVDKGLQPYRGVALALHALERLAPQVAAAAINANRNLAAYRALGAPVWPDTLDGHPGPLAGFLAGLDHCHTDFLVTVPCDGPRFPTDLVARLAQGLVAADAEIAVAATAQDGSREVQPVFCLMRCTVRASLASYLHAGQGKVARWLAQHRLAEVPFDDASAFANANTLDELQALQGGD